MLVGPPKVQGKQNSHFRIFRYNCLHPHLQQAKVSRRPTDSRQAGSRLPQIRLMEHEHIIMKRNDIIDITSFLKLQ